ncbi:MAG: 4Fe-4S binding protein [Gemmatimonadales bacterium]|nr:MAG: 4Fe-4S binding protein [Gemmatimonadales bacterium]
MARRVSALQWIRLATQVGVATAALIAGVRLARGWSLAGVEKYCPFGGLETIWSFVTRRSFSCAAGELNLALFLALLGLTLIARKAFCSWVCPVGSVNEWIFRLVRWTGTRWPLEPPPRVDHALRWLRLPVLAVILFFTWRTGELVFRGYDPYYILTSAHGHEVKLWSYALLAAVLALGVVVPMAWCRYLCPLGVTLWPFSVLGRLRLRRTESRCTACAACSSACPHGIDVAGSTEVRSGECTLCLECTEACPAGGALELRLEGPKP